MTFDPVQIPDSRWRFFRGLARLAPAKPVRGLLCSAGITRHFYRHAFLIADLLRRFVV